MNLSQRISLVVKLGQYMLSNHPDWKKTKEKAFFENGWFLPEFIDISVNNIVNNFLDEKIINLWLSNYPAIRGENRNPKKIGVVMAGNIPLVGFHDFLCTFLSGHNLVLKASSKDEALIKHLIEKLVEWESRLDAKIRMQALLKGCDAYIATGSNSTGNHFHYYFGKYPHLIRRNRTSVAILTGDETKEDLLALADDVYLFFGLGCRNITKIYVPENFDFEQMINVFKKYDYLADVHKYKNNYDYNLALHLLNHTKYMSNAALLIIENKDIFSPVGQLNYEVYQDLQKVNEELRSNNEIQCIVGKGAIPFGKAQYPTVDQYADGKDTMAFLSFLI